MSFVINQLPQNDHELNLLIGSMNRAYGKYFDFEVSEKRSNKLRDCICEGLGFTNGGYQQLRAHWQANISFDFTDPDLVLGIVSERRGGYETIMAKPFAWQFLLFLCTYFPFVDGQFCREDNLPDGMMFHDNAEYEWYGWEPIELDSREHAHVPATNKSQGQWFPLYYGQYVVGYSFSEEEAFLMNTILLSAKMNDKVWQDQDILTAGKIGPAWKTHIEKVSEEKIEFLVPEKYLSLRQSGMELGLVFPFDELSISESDILLVNGNQRLTFIHNKDDDTVSIEGQSLIRFDFSCAYGKSLTVQSGEQDLFGNFHSVGENENGFTSIEWFGRDRVEMIPIDGDYDSMVTSGYSVAGSAVRVY